MFNFFLSLLNLKINTHFSHSSIKKTFSEVAQTRESLRRPYFPLPRSILAGTNLIMFLFFLQPPFDSQENLYPIRFPGKFILVWFPRKYIQNPQGKPKNLLFFAPCVFWICFRGLFAVVPLELNFTNPKSTIFEPGWKTQPLPANHDQITK